MVTGQHPRLVTDACRIPTCPRESLLVVWGQDIEEPVKEGAGLIPGHCWHSLLPPIVSSSAWAMAVPNPVIKYFRNCE